MKNFLFTDKKKGDRIMGIKRHSKSYMENTEVLLIHPPISFKTIVAGGYDNIPPMGILYLAAVLEKHGIKVKIIDDLDASISLKEILKEIKKLKPKIIGISSTTSQIKSSVEIAKAIKTKVDKNIQIGIGGCHVSADPDLLKRYHFFDFGVLGEGEKIFLELVNKILKGEKCKGLFVGEAVEDLDTIPFPAFHLVDMSKYKRRGLNCYPIIGTRGCPMRCVFCSRAGMAGFGRMVRSRSAKNIVDEMEKAIGEYNGYFGFCDDSFTVNRDSVVNFCKEVTKRKLKVKWNAGGVRIDKIDKELIDIMVKAGCIGFCFGIESGSERIRNIIVRKGVWDNQIYNALKICNKYPLDIQLALIIGFPTETKEEMEETVMFGRKLINMGIKCIDYIAIMLAVPLPGADLFKQAVDEKKMPKDIIDRYIDGKLGEGFRDHWPVYIPDGVTRKEMDNMRKRGYKSFYFTPYYIKRRIKKDVKSLGLLKRDATEFCSILTSSRSKASFS